MTVTDIYIQINDKMNTEELALKLKKCYNEHDRIRYILDTCGSGVSNRAMNKLKKVFDKFEKQAEEKLIETCIVVDGDVKRFMIKSFVKLFNSKDNVRVI